MSHTRVKMIFTEDGFGWSPAEEKTVYCHHNGTSDYTTVYYNDGKVLFSGSDQEIHAILSVLLPFKEGDDYELKEGVKYMDADDRIKCGL